MIKFNPRSDCKYKYNYEKVWEDVGDAPDENGLAILRSLILSDLFFIVCGGVLSERKHSVDHRNPYPQGKVRVQPSRWPAERPV